MSVNKAIILGFVGNEPEIKKTKDGDNIAKFSVATSESWKDKNSGEKKEKTEWHSVTAFGNLANVVANYVKKGSKVYVEGSIKTDKYTDKDGIERYATKIVLQGFNSTLQLLDSKDKESKPMDEHNQSKGNGYQKDTIGLVPQKVGYEEEVDNSEVPF